jgi:RepB DNA-primase from phage plasmid
MSPKVKDLIARFAPADRPFASFIPQERRHAFLDELSQMTGRMLPSEQAKIWEDFCRELGMTLPSKSDPTLPSSSETEDSLNQPQNNASTRRPKIAKDLIRAHNHLIHTLAAPLTGNGKIIVAGFGENPTQIDNKTGKPGRRLRPRVYQVDVGDEKQTAESIADFLGQPHYNLYMPLAVYGTGLPAGQKGSEADVIACLGLVADFDDSDAARWSERLPIPPDYVLETSTSRFQAFYLFDKPASVVDAKPVAERLKSFAQCDHGTSDLSHVWRVPGALNWPNAKKLGEGRSPEPQLVRVAKKWDGSTTSLQTLSDSLPVTTPPASKSALSQHPSSTADTVSEPKHGPHPARIAGRPENAAEALTLMAPLPFDLQEEIRRPESGDRSKAIFKVIAKLIEHGLDDAAILKVINAHPEGIGEKYADRNDLDREVVRVRAKTQISAPMTRPATRPVVQVRAGALPMVVDQAEQHLIEADPNIFQRGSVIVRPVQDFIPTMGGKQTVGARLVTVGIPHLVDRLSRTIDFQKQNSQGVWFSVNCPKQIAETYLGRDGEWKLPILTRIINTPTLREDGSVLEEPGYDMPSGLLFDPQGVQFPAIPLEPNLLDAVEAAIYLCGPLNTFPFVDDASRAVALSAILTSLIRPSLPASPLHAFTAPVRGSGKSLLVDIASMIASGHEAPVIAQGHTAEEFEKRLGAMFLAGDATIAIDNCERPLEGEFLCQVLTQLRVTIRELGHSRKVVVPTNASLFATGNNLQIKGDLTRRTIVCFLDPRCERPELRSFETSPLDLIRRDRPRYVAAALTLLRYAASDQIPSWAMCNPLGSFERWSRWVRAAVIIATGTDPCATMERIQTQDPEVERLVAVLHEWTTAIGERAVTTSEVIEIATRQRPLHSVAIEEKRFVHDAFRDALLVVAAMGGNIDSRRLGVWLGRNKDRIVGGKKIVMGPMASGLNQWQVVPVGGVTLRQAA